MISSPSISSDGTLPRPAHAPGAGRAPWILPALAAVSLGLFSFAASAQDRVAFVIGQSGYKTFSTLDNPKQDEPAITKAFQACGFAVTRGQNLATAQLKEGLKKFAADHADAKEVIFYFSGHGLQIHGINYLTGVDSSLDVAEKERKLAEAFEGDELIRQREVLLRQEATRSMWSLEEVTAMLSRTGTPDAVRVIILDCCRDNPLKTKGLLGGKGLAAAAPPSGMLIAFAAQEGSTAAQTKDGELSLYTRELLKTITRPGLEAEQVFKQTRSAVKIASRGAQIPAEYSLLEGSLVFVPRAEEKLKDPVQADHGAKPAAEPVQATKESPFENLLGMKFVPAGTKGVMFSIWETRRRDWEAWVADGGGNGDTKWMTSAYKGVALGQGKDHPVVCISRENAERFCDWLTRRERAAGRIGQLDKFRLPTDKEWSAAVGLPLEEGKTPVERDNAGKDSGIYPWGRAWPPPVGAGNYADSAASAQFGTRWSVIDGYADGYEGTAPVGSFSANMFGLFDMGGNVWELCGDWYDSDEKKSVQRGGSWCGDTPAELRSSCRYSGYPSFRIDGAGFRVVLAVRNTGG